MYLPKTLGKSYHTIAPIKLEQAMFIFDAFALPHDATPQMVSDILGSLCLIDVTFITKLIVLCCNSHNCRVMMIFLSSVSFNATYALSLYLISYLHSSLSSGFCMSQSKPLKTRFNIFL